MMKPPPKIDAETVRRVAHLARIDVSDEEIKHLIDELRAILAWIDTLNEVDTSDTQPFEPATEFSAPLRDDKVHTPPPREAILANAPDTRDGFFVVPKTVA